MIDILAETPETEHGPEMTRLLDRLFGDPNKKTMNFNVFPGPKWNELSEEERAKTINDALDSIEDGTAEEITHFDD